MAIFGLMDRMFNIVEQCNTIVFSSFVLPCQTLFNNVLSPMEKDCTLGFRLPCRLRDDLQKLADENRRKLSDFLVLELEKIVSDSKKRKKP